MSQTLFLSLRMHAMSYQSDALYTTFRAEDFLIDEMKNDYVGYNRPYFNSPNINNINVYNLINVLESCLQQHGYHTEAKELLNFCYENLDIRAYDRINFVNDLINHAAHYLDMPSAVTKKEIDGEIFFKLNTTPSFLFNIKEFNDTNKEKLRFYIKNGFDITSKNTYEKTIFSYLNSIEELKYLWQQNKILKNNNKPFVNVFSLDVFHNTLLHSAKSIEMFSFYLNVMNNENLELAKLLFKGKNIFNKPACEVFTNQTIQWISTLTQKIPFNEQGLDIFVDAIDKIEQVDPNYALEFQNIINDEESFVKLVANSEDDKHLFYELFQKALVKEKLNYKLPEKTTLKKIKI